MFASGHLHKTRIAPTPSGYLHLGNILSFALTAALAEKSGASVLLRIDDMDQGRAKPQYIRDIFDTLHFLGLPWTEGPQDAQEFEDRYSQIHRLQLYTQALNKLRDTGLIYACNCSRAKIHQNNPKGIYPGTCRYKNIPLDTPGVTWRLNTETAEVITIKTLDTTFLEARLPAEMQDVVIRKKDGLPAYQLSSVVDDALYNIDLIVRGQDLWPSTLVQMHIATLLKENTFLNTSFYHHPLVMSSHQRKLSKSAGDTSVHYLREQGSLPEDIYIRLGQTLQLSEETRYWWSFAFMLPD